MRRRTAISLAAPLCLVLALGVVAAGAQDDRDPVVVPYEGGAFEVDATECVVPVRGIVTDRTTTERVGKPTRVTARIALLAEVEGGEWAVVHESPPFPVRGEGMQLEASFCLVEVGG